MSRLRQRGMARISFFSFQDIITSVTGILILVTLMLSFSVQTAEPSEDQQRETRLQTERERLAQIERENEAIQRRRLEAETLPDPTQARATLEAMRKEGRQVSDQLQRSEAALRELQAQAERQKPVAELRNELAQVDENLHALQEKLAREKTNSNVVFIIPDAETRRSSKQPVAIVVNETKAAAQRLNGAEARETTLESVESASALLARYNAERDFLVFYFRPSGVKWFDAFRAAARRIGFEMGYDALEENKQIIFNAP